MFIATSRGNDPSSVGAECDSLDDMSFLRSLLNHIEPMDYKYFIPTGLRQFFSSWFVVLHNGNTLSEHYPIDVTLFVANVR